MRLGPGLSFSWKRAISLTALRQPFARRAGVPTTRGGLERKVGRTLIDALTGALTGRRRKW